MWTVKADMMLVLLSPVIGLLGRGPEEKEKGQMENSDGQSKHRKELFFKYCIRDVHMIVAHLFGLTKTSLFFLSLFLQA